MSDMTVHDLNCPHCGNKQETPVFDSINVTLDPDLKEKLFAGEINLFRCQKCGENAFINIPLLYHDMDREFCAKFYPVEALDDPEFYQEFNSDGSIALDGMPEILAELGTYLARPHIVFDMNEMIRYVRFRDKIAGTSTK